MVSTVSADRGGCMSVSISKPASGSTVRIQRACLFTRPAWLPPTVTKYLTAAQTPVRSCSSDAAPAVKHVNDQLYETASNTQLVWKMASCRMTMLS